MGAERSCILPSARHPRHIHVVSLVVDPNVTLPTLVLITVTSGSHDPLRPPSTTTLGQHQDSQHTSDPRQLCEGIVATERHRHGGDETGEADSILGSASTARHAHPYLGAAFMIEDTEYTSISSGRRRLGDTATHLLVIGVDPGGWVVSNEPVTSSTHYLRLGTFRSHGNLQCFVRKDFDWNVSSARSWQHKSCRIKSSSVIFLQAQSRTFRFILPVLYQTPATLLQEQGKAFFPTSLSFTRLTPPPPSQSRHQ